MKKKTQILIVIAMFVPILLIGQSPVLVNPPNHQDDEVIISRYELMPEFKGGEKALYRFIGDNLKMPNDTLPKDKGRIVICRFLVEKDGTIDQISILRGLAPSFDEEALRILKIMPKWNPGKQGGKPVAIWYTFPIRFDNSYSKKKK